MMVTRKVVRKVREREAVVCEAHPDSDWYREVREVGGRWEAWAICWADKKEIALLAEEKGTVGL